jgi:hypothetical protein
MNRRDFMKMLGGIAGVLTFGLSRPASAKVVPKGHRATAWLALEQKNSMPEREWRSLHLVRETVSRGAYMRPSNRPDMRYGAVKVTLWEDVMTRADGSRGVLGYCLQRIEYYAHPSYFLPSWRRPTDVLTRRGEEQSVDLAIQFDGDRKWYIIQCWLDHDGGFQHRWRRFAKDCEVVPSPARAHGLQV